MPHYQVINLETLGKRGTRVYALVRHFTEQEDQLALRASNLMLFGPLS